MCLLYNIQIQQSEKEMAIRACLYKCSASSGTSARN